MSGPLALALLGLAVPVVWAYLRRSPLPRTVVPSALPFRVLPSAQPHRRRRPEEWLSLVLVLLALGAVTAALVLRPRVGRHVVVVVDDSASMGAGDRMATARAQLDRWLAAAPDDALTVIATSPPRILRSRATDPTGVRRMVGSLTPTGSGGDVQALARAACADDGAVLLVLSDELDGADWSCGVRYAPLVGAGPSEPLITGLAVERADALGQLTLQLGIAAPSDAPARVSLAVDGEDLEPVVVSLRGGQGHVRLRRAVGEGQRLSATTGGGSVELVLPSSRPVRVALVTDAPRGYTALALRAHPAVELQVVDPAEVAEGPVDLLVVEASPSAPLPEAELRVALGVDPRSLGLPAASRVRAPAALAPVDDRLFWRVDLDRLAVGDAWMWADGAGEPLLRSSRGVLGARVPGPDGDWVAVGLSPSSTDWPLRVGFVHFVANLVDVARPDTGAESLQAAPAAEVLADARVAGVPLPPLTASWRQAALAAGALLCLEALLGLRRRRG